MESLKIIFKWGCDGSTGHSQYEQKFSAPDEGYDDSDVFVISLVPLQMYSKYETGQTIVWQNPRPSSTRFCRPIKLKETKKMAITEINKIEKEIENLKTTEVMVNGKEIKILTKMLLTMVDGKICNAITGSSSQSCYFCGCTPKDMNNIGRRTTECDVTAFKFGLTTLHVWIRFMECLLHIAYRLDVKVTNEEK